MTVWTSAHLHFDEPRGDVYGAAADRVVRDGVAPLVERMTDDGWVERWFFVRYLDEDGPHVRLRLEGERETLARHVEPRVAALVSETEAVREVRCVPYEPEIDRYGGPEATLLAERWFHASSDAALRLLAGLDPADRPARLGRGLLAFLTLLHAFLPQRRDAAARADEYARRYLVARVPDEASRRGWNRAFAEGFERQAERLGALVGTVWDVLDGGGEPPEEIVTFRRATILLRDRLAELAEAGRLAASTPLRIVPSYLHLMSNRLGVSIPEEMYLATLVHRTLSPNAELTEFRRETSSPRISNPEGKETSP